MPPCPKGSGPERTAANLPGLNRFGFSQEIARFQGLLSMSGEVWLLPFYAHRGVEEGPRLLHDVYLFSRIKLPHTLKFNTTYRTPIITVGGMLTNQGAGGG